MNHDLYNIAVTLQEAATKIMRLAVGEAAIATAPFAPVMTPDGHDVLSPKEQQVMSLVAANPGIARRNLQAQTGLGADNLSYTLKRLCAKDLIERRGERAASRYWPSMGEPEGKRRSKKVA